MRFFECDYTEGACPEIMNRLMETNFMQTPGYGEDVICDSARAKIRKSCDAEHADVHFLVGGTQANLTVIASVLRPYQGVFSAETGHINVHETGAIEATGHKVLALPSTTGKITAEQVKDYYDAHWADGSHEHIVQPGMVYISHPTENGTLYTKAELKELYQMCQQLELPLFLDGARLGYGLMSEGNNVTIKDIARLSDVFYIGGTKVGALFGEAIVASNSNLLPHFFTTIKQHGALLAKGRLLGIQFETLFTDNLYYNISKHAVEQAIRIRDSFVKNGYKLAINSPSNQQFIVLPNEIMDKLSEYVSFEVWGKRGETETTVRFVTSWATQAEDVDSLINILTNIKQ